MKMGGAVVNQAKFKKMVKTGMTGVAKLILSSFLPQNHHLF